MFLNIVLFNKTMIAMDYNSHSDANWHLWLAIMQMNPESVKKYLKEHADPATELDDSKNNGMHLFFKAPVNEKNRQYLPQVAKLLLPYAGTCWFKKNSNGKLPLDYFDPYKKHAYVADLIIDIAYPFLWQTYGRHLLEQEPKTKEAQLAAINALMRSDAKEYKTKIETIEKNRSKK